MTRPHFVTLPWGSRVRPAKVDAVDIGRVGIAEDPVFFFVEVHVDGRVIISDPCKKKDDAVKLRDETADLIEEGVTGQCRLPISTDETKPSPRASLVAEGILDDAVLRLIAEGGVGGMTRGAIHSGLGDDTTYGVLERSLSRLAAKGKVTYFRGLWSAIP